jgi:hypothetical protein
MNFKDFIKDKLIIFIMYPIFGIISLLTMDDAPNTWKAIVPTFFFGMPLGVLIYGILVYRND